MTAADVSSQRIDIPQPGRYQISPAHSTVTIRTRHLFGLGPVRALIALRDGRIVVAGPPEASTVQARFAAATFRSGNGTRDAAASAHAGIDRYDFGIATYRGLAARRLTIDLDIIAHREQS